MGSQSATFISVSLLNIYEKHFYILLCLKYRKSINIASMVYIVVPIE